MTDNWLSAKDILLVDPQRVSEHEGYLLQALSVCLSVCLFVSPVSVLV